MEYLSKINAAVDEDGRLIDNQWREGIPPVNWGVGRMGNSVEVITANNYEHIRSHHIN